MTAFTSVEVPFAWDDFYKKFAYLYYGIMAEANATDTDSMELMRKSVSRFWNRNAASLPGFQGYTPNKIDSLFDWLALNETDASYCKNEVLPFFSQHADEIPTSLKQFITASAKEIAQLAGSGNSEFLTDLEARMQ
jgi:hypothetical protein